MRVLMTTDCVGGVWSYAMTLCGALAAHDVNVTLAATGGPLPEEKRREVPATVDLRYEPFRCEWMQPPLADVKAAGRWLDELVAEIRPDVVHLNEFAHGGRFDLPTLIVAHSDVANWHRHVLDRGPDASWDGYAAAVAGGLRGADAVVALTQSQISDLKSSYAAVGDFRVISNAVAADVEPAAVREPFVLTAGRVWDEAKNVRALAEAAGGLAWPVKVAGDATHPDGGTASFENVELLGPLPRGELLELMSRAGVYALPAKYEPFGLSAVEAAMCGCPLVLGDIASLREVWGDAATFVPPDDADALRSALTELIEDPDLRAARATAARGRAVMFTPERQAAAYAELYRELAASA